MSTIDVSTIEGFDGMTAEQKVEALLKTEIPEKIDLSGYVKKDLFDRTASELAEAKKQAKAHMTEDEAAKAQADAERKALEERCTAAEKKVAISEHTARYLAMPGYDEALARETAEALFEGNMDKVFENQKKANEEYEKKLKSEILKGTPRPGGGGNGGEEDPENVKLAKKISAQRTAAMKSASDTLKNYL